MAQGKGPRLLVWSVTWTAKSHSPTAEIKAQEGEEEKVSTAENEGQSIGQHAQVPIIVPFL